MRRGWPGLVIGVSTERARLGDPQTLRVHRMRARFQHLCLLDGLARCEPEGEGDEHLDPCSDAQRRCSAYRSYEDTAYKCSDEKHKDSVCTVVSRRDPGDLGYQYIGFLLLALKARRKGPTAEIYERDQDLLPARTIW